MEHAIGRAMRLIKMGRAGGGSCGVTKRETMIGYVRTGCKQRRGYPATTQKNWGENVGQTPMIDLTPLDHRIPDGVKVFGKCEFLNPSGSIKDRIVKHIIEENERKGTLVPNKGQTIVAASSGNTAASLAMFCAIKGYKCILITNKKTSDEKIAQLGAYGAEVIVTESGVDIEDPRHYQNVETRMVEENADYFGINQYDNPLNPEAYYQTLGPEIWLQTEGKVSHFVAAGSTGGTLTGTARFLKKMKPECRAVMPDPHGSIFYEMWAHNKRIKPGKFEVEGVGKDSIPLCLDLGLVDDMPRFSDEQAFSTCRKMSSTMGVMVGGSAGGNVFSSLELARSLDAPATIVTILCDSGVKYLSKIFNDQWIAEKGYTLDENDWAEYKVGSLGDTGLV